ncbi:AbrB/MazE/SpoVT family DNA-binding domain-containing protein [Mesorhizobium sp. 8]|uniref:AbrB/MazE/SpoVT family DNA-binding domain-containing protein n=1 Tax=Mesorhizobium sp. 8 TaxID=2584466 RepID=UPI001123CA40|nr:AbrB/MazE/SpoVT family DNA-binding domain-containing protein [Mesorhizobium sp. 8]QDB99981.1 AbrB/MazE/SpoVT family DNA-binding domain-containing protein [Mesorhizobium sp. 8]
MNVRAKISSKGQLVLPKAVRDAYGLDAGSEVEVESAGDVILLRPSPKKTRNTYTLDEAAGFLKYEGPSVTLKDMERAIEEEARRKWNAARS